MENELTHDELIALRNELRTYGYDARLVNVGAFDIHHGRYVHYMSQDEAIALLKYAKTHKMIDDILDFAEWHGLNYWYTFPE